ncbi:MULTISPECIES: LysR family transcriptional regulator [unclassified Paenibacillus]|uniref:LysR family transcriptional regulator n=1 Tax=unclassified Paenibacillus TaxID=185978 RepID=UPI00278AD220|nr:MULTISPECIES: LysR family transcriptional regulator [unclassified Paenibacillus]MDQ0897710.1 DNA-binding transcriptional LysR family regulator [Paenibacillus sp. V4I7]MDQ0916297.1 DNA-binding transcriptional LysR family regulator [Paenibacillus sp. V4I5]
MDLKQLDYMIKIAEENNITKAAEKLFITQSALNQQLLRLEKELGTQLFVRSRSNWHLTHAGKIYVENAKEIVRIKKETYNRINDMLEIKEGKLIVGLTPERGIKMFAAIYPILYKKYPNVKIEPIEMPVKKQQYEISQGNLDIGFLTLQNSQKTNDHYIHICSEKIILGVPNAHPLAHLGGKIGEQLPEISLKRFENDSFAIMQKGSTLREIYDHLINEENISPDILLETRSCQTLFKMVAEGICCSIFPITYAKPSTNISYFSIKQNPEWEVAASYKKGSYLCNVAHDLIRISTDYWTKKMMNYG